jgi:hypothetical protein
MIYNVYSYNKSTSTYSKKFLQTNLGHETLVDVMAMTNTEKFNLFNLAGALTYWCDSKVKVINNASLLFINISFSLSYFIM